MSARAWGRPAVYVLAGLLLGLILGRVVPGRRHRSPELRQARAIERLSRELGLDAEQRRRAEALLGASFSKGEAVRAKAAAELTALKESALEQLAPSLTPEQKAKLEALKARRRERDARKTKEGARLR